MSERAIAHSISETADQGRNTGHEAAGSKRWYSISELYGDSQLIAGMLVASASVRKTMSAVARIAPYKTAALVHGESGVGKELVARAIHRQGPCPNGPFVTFNCSNLVESLAESQLFGHVKGAFTDAREESLGYFRSADGGTLFLDEVGELPLKLQPKLLRAVESHEVQPVGSARTHKVDIRLVCATNRDLKAMVKEGTFRADLYYRLNTTAITVAPLRERRDGIPAMVAYFVEHHGQAFGKTIRFISHEALMSLCSAPWPGNVRQLSHAIQSALMMTDSDRIALSDLPEPMTVNEELSASAEAATPTTASEFLAREGAQDELAPHSLDAAIERASKNALTQALDATAGNCIRAAQLMGVSRYTVYRMINRYGVTGFKGRGAYTGPV